MRIVNLEQRETHEPTCTLSVLSLLTFAFISPITITVSPAIIPSSGSFRHLICSRTSVFHYFFCCLHCTFRGAYQENQTSLTQCYSFPILFLCLSTHFQLYPSSLTLGLHILPYLSHHTLCLNQPTLPQLAYTA